MGKLSNIKEQEKKEKGLRGSCLVLSKKIAKHKDVVPLTEQIAALQIGIDELIPLKVAINEAAKYYNLPPLTATLRLIDDIKKYNKIGGLKKEASRLCQQVFVVNGVWANQNKAMMAMINLQVGE